MVYPILEVVGYDKFEPIGTKQKFWFRAPDETPWLFKVGRPGTGENWSEKATSELAKLLNLPCAQYELAKWEEHDGVVSPSFIPTKGRLALGNEVLARIVPNYDPAKTYQSREYKLFTVCAILKKLRIENSPLESKGAVSQLTPLEVFTGYLVFDCWIGNPDRHHENWGFVVTSDVKIHLAPTFDHASGLGVRVLDSEREGRLRTRDRGYSVESYVKKARTPFRDANGKNLYTLDVVRELAKHNSEKVAFWVERLSKISSEQMEDVFAAMPDGVMSTLEVEFAMKVLEVNRRRLEDLL